MAANKSDDAYEEHSALDAPTHLLNVLEHFFSTPRNRYKFSPAFHQYDKIKSEGTFVEAKRIFRIITGTSLVTDHHVSSHKTTQGFRYRISRGYLQLLARAERNRNRQNANPFSALESQTTAGSDPSTVLEATAPDTPKHVNVITTPEPETNDDDASSINTDVTKHADDIARNMDTVLADLNDDKQHTDENNNDNVSTLIQQLVHDGIQNALRDLQTKSDAIDTNMNRITMIQQQLDTLHEKYIEFDKTIRDNNEKLSHKLTYFTRKMESYDRVYQDWTSQTQSLNDKSTLIETELRTTHTHMKKRLQKLKETTKVMFKQQEDDYEILTDRIYRMESEISNIKKKTRPVKPQKLSFSTSGSDSDPSQVSDSLQPKPSSPIPSNTKSSRPLDSTYTRYDNTTNTRTPGPDAEYLRKNINITCTDTNQILEFYIKLRLAVAKGGIFLLPIENLTKSQDICEIRQQDTEYDRRIQANALYTLLSNEKYIPADFTMAQNCILGYSNNMDGFSALKAMLKLTHPALNMKRPSNVPPTLSDATDIHNYEQALRNYYLLHKLFNKTEYTAIEKSKQFIRGIMNDERYDGAVKRIQYQLDTAVNLNIPLHDDLTLDNIAGTIINLTGEYDHHENTIVRTARAHNGPRPAREFNRPYTPRNNGPRKNNHANTHRFTNVQCHACKLFGHSITHCKLLPKVLAIMQFKHSNKQQCDNVLSAHITNNSVESKKSFVRVLQQANVLPDDEDSDVYMEDDIVVNTMTDNAVYDADLNDTTE